MSVEGRVAVITGATGAVGRAVARRIPVLADVVALIGRSREKLDAACRELETAGVRTVALAGDFARHDDVRRMAGEMERFTRIDVLVHCAGAIALGDFAEASLDDLDRQYEVNVRAPFALTQALLPMVRRCAGQVVFVNSTAGLTARATVGQYAATKHALKAVADSLREEVNAGGIRVLSVFLGRTASAMQEYIHDVEGTPYRPDRLIQPDDVAAMILSALSLPRTAEVTEIRIRPMAKPTTPVSG